MFASSGPLTISAGGPGELSKADGRVQLFGYDAIVVWNKRAPANDWFQHNARLSSCFGSLKIQKGAHASFCCVCAAPRSKEAALQPLREMGPESLEKVVATKARDETPPTTTDSG